MQLNWSIRVGDIDSLSSTDHSSSFNIQESSQGCLVVLAEITLINQYASLDFLKVEICQKGKKKRGNRKKHMYTVQVQYAKSMRVIMMMMMMTLFY